MSDLSWMRGLFPGTAVAESIARVLDLYREFSEELDAFRATQDFGCPDGCGRCCEVTDPEVTRAEADFLASYLVAKRTAHAWPAATSHAGCIFYDPSQPLHCTVYAARPLLCRAFAFTSVLDKTGNPVFRFCRHMPAPEPRVVAGAEFPVRFPVAPPSMPLYGVRLDALAEAGEREPLSRAIVRSLARVQLLKRIAAETGDGDNNRGGGDQGDDNDGGGGQGGDNDGGDGGRGGSFDRGGKAA
jgi:uncharacterized protein